MARTGWSAANFLRNANGIITAAPLTVAGWGWTSIASAAQTLFFLGLSTGTTSLHQFRVGVNATNNVFAQTGDASAAVTGTTSTTYSASTWFHWAGVFGLTTGTDRAAFLNGAGKGTNITNRTPVGINRCSIGFRDNAAADEPFAPAGTGYIAEVGLWNTNLTDAEIVVLAAGVSPLLVRPENLVSYWPILGQSSPEPDLVGSFNQTIQGTLTQANHPRIYYPHGRQRYTPVPSAIAEIDFSPGSSTAGHSSTPFSLTASYNLAFANITAGHTANAFGLTAAYTLPMVGATAGHTTTPSGLLLTRLLGMANATTGHEATSFDVDVAAGLTVAPVAAIAGHTATDVSLSLASIIKGANADAGHTTNAVALAVANILRGVSATAGHNANPSGLTLAQLLALVSSSTGHTTNAAALAVANTLRTVGATTGHNSAPIALTLARILTLVNSDAGHTAGAGGLTVSRVISAADALAGHTATAFGLSNVIVVGIASPIAGHNAEPLLIFVPQQGPYDFSVSPETRVLAVTNDGRAFAIHARVESFTVNGETRLLIVPKRTGTVVVYEDRRVGPANRTLLVSPRQIGNVQRQGSSTTSATPPDTDFLLLEDGNYLLQEDGSRIRA